MCSKKGNSWYCLTFKIIQWIKAPLSKHVASCGDTSCIFFHLLPLFFVPQAMFELVDNFEIRVEIYLYALFFTYISYKVFLEHKVQT